MESSCVVPWAQISDISCFPANQPLLFFFFMCVLPKKELSVFQFMRLLIDYFHLTRAETSVKIQGWSQKNLSFLHSGKHILFVLFIFQRLLLLLLLFLTKGLWYLCLFLKFHLGMCSYCCC